MNEKEIVEDVERLNELDWDLPMWELWDFYETEVNILGREYASEWLDDQIPVLVKSFEDMNDVVLRETALEYFKENALSFYFNGF